MVHLSFRMKETKKEDSKKKASKAKKDDKKKDGEGEESTINYHPKIEKCDVFLKGALSTIVESTNKVCNLEDDLMPFL